MRFSAVATLLLLGVLGLGQPAKAVSIQSDLIGVGWDEVSALLFEISPAGPGTAVGSAGVPRLNSLAMAPGNDLWSAVALLRASQGGPGPLDGWLVSIDLSGPDDALATPIAEIDIGGGIADVRGLTFDLAGTLFFINDGGTSQAKDDLYRVTSINTDTQVATAELIAETAFSGIQALTTSPSGVLYAWDVNAGLLTVDPSTGATTDVNLGQGGTGDIQGLAFLPDGRLFGARNRLFTIDPSTGALTADLGLILPGEAANVRGLAGVPEPAAGLLLALGATGLALLRRRVR